MCSVSSIATFQGTPYASDGTGGKLYVPRSRVEAYRTTGQWKTIYGYGTCDIRALEDYTVDGTILGDLDPNKI